VITRRGAGDSGVVRRNAGAGVGRAAHIALSTWKTSPCRATVSASRAIGPRTSSSRSDRSDEAKSPFRTPRRAGAMKSGPNWWNVFRPQRDHRAMNGRRIGKSSRPLWASYCAHHSGLPGPGCAETGRRPAGVRHRWHLLGQARAMPTAAHFLDLNQPAMIPTMNSSAVNRATRNGALSSRSARERRDHQVSSPVVPSK